MTMTARKPVSVGEMLTAEFMEPMALTQSALADAMGVPRKHVQQPSPDYRPHPRPCLWQ